MAAMPLSPLAKEEVPAPGTPARPLLPEKGELCVVVGAGRSGRAACRLLSRLGAGVRLLEAQPEALSGELKDELEALGVEIVLGPHRPEHFAGAAFVIPSPGVPLRSLLKAMELPPDQPLESAAGPSILAETELACRCLEGEQVLAVTGTSGKTTTVHLMRAMLEAAGIRTFLGGNVGTPLSEYILAGRGAQAVVLEISSFQLQTCLRLRPRVAVLMNITPNHLDYHEDLEEYRRAKFRLFACQEKDDLAILPEEWRGSFEKGGFAARILVPEAPASAAAGRFPETQLIGAHNALNAEIAWQAVRELGVSLEAARTAVKNFAPLPHRLERVAEKNGVLYVNDSKCTTFSSLETALRAMDRPVLLLCGGRYKGGDPLALLPLVREKVRLAAGFGESREIFQPAWEKDIPVRWFPTLEPAVRWLSGEARPGETVLLSPGTASFDLYRGMAYRGADFRRIVEALP